MRNPLCSIKCQLVESEKDFNSSFIDSLCCQEHKSKLLVFTALLATICFMSSLLAIMVKACHRSRSRSMIPTGRDLDTVSSDLDLSVDLQLHEMTSATTSCQTLLPSASSSTKVEFKPKGILKNSKTSENFRLETKHSKETKFIKEIPH